MVPDFCGYRDGTGGSLRLDPVEQRILDDWLQGETVGLAAAPRFDVVVHGDASTVPILLNQKIILDQISSSRSVTMDEVPLEHF